MSDTNTHPAPDAPRLVPDEPTPEMVKAGVRCAQNNHADFVREAYRAMLASAPAVQPAAGREEIVNHDCLAKRRPGEPMFILLGRDPDAHNIVRLWAERRLAAGGDPEHCQMGLDTAKRMAAYAADPVNRPASAPDASDYPAISTPAQASGEATAWARRWFIDGITPKKERNENGRTAWPKKFTYHEVTRVKVMKDDVALYAHPPAPASETGGEVTDLIAAAKAVTMAAWTDRFGRLHGHETVAALERALAALSAPQAAPGEGEQS